MDIVKAFEELKSKMDRIEQLLEAKQPDNGDDLITLEKVAQDNGYKGTKHMLRKVRASGVDLLRLGKKPAIKIRDTQRVLAA